MLLKKYLFQGLDPWSWKLAGWTRPNRGWFSPLLGSHTQSFAWALWRAWPCQTWRRSSRRRCCLLRPSQNTEPAPVKNVVELLYFSNKIKFFRCKMCIFRKFVLIRIIFSIALSGVTKYWLLVQVDKVFIVIKYIYITMSISYIKIIKSTRSINIKKRFWLWQT